MAHLVAEHLTFTYPQAAGAAVHDVSLEVERGSFVLVCGRSGCGKTTLLRHLKPELAPHGTRSGRVLLDGRDLFGLPAGERAGRVAFVAQHPEEQLVCDRVWHELAFGLENQGVEQSEMRARVAEMASYFGMGDWFRRDVAGLSGGQKQLVNLAAAMVLQPEVLVLDEPTAQLDPIAASDFLATVRTLNLELGTTVVMSEHRLEEAYALADQVVVMEAGRVVACGAPREVACLLQARGHEMALALPTPARVFYQVGVLSKRPCPLAVREGRAWLGEELVGREAAGEVSRGDAAGGARVAEGDFGRVPVVSTGVAAAGARVVESGEQAGLRGGWLAAARAGLREAVAGGRLVLRGEELALNLRDVWFRYTQDGPDVLRGLDLRVSCGERYAVVGANGAGKSTLLKVICGVCAAQRGRIEVLGEPLRRRRASLFRGCLALLPQDPSNLLVQETVRADLEEMREPSDATRGGRFARAFAGGKRAARDGLLTRIAELCGIEGLLERHPRDLSGGERQRVALAKVLLVEPRIVLLDEPTKGFDALAKRDFAHVLARLQADGTTVVMVSHDIEFCAEHTDRVGLFFDGQMVSEGTPRQFFAANAFYTTAARRMARGLVEGAVTADDLIRALAGEGSARCEGTRCEDERHKGTGAL